MPEEQDLLQRASRLETKALTEIYDTYSPGMYRYAARLLGDSNLAEDCVAEAFARFLDALQKRKGPRDHLQAYLYRIAHNWVVDSYRKQKGDVELDEMLASGDHPEEDAAKHIRQTQLRKAIKKLTPDQQQVIALKYLEGWNNEEIAHALNKPIGAVKSIHHRALKSLQRFLEERVDHEESKRVGNPAEKEFGSA
ncbi:MAG TPA: RNA polymerase subunit sigma-70 [Anaerolineae bacterium]|nr:RNA polymerase subunit sigma-70 [Anaerolineae bacterium]HRJ56096.1 sigma-70 family RNA polymerase sigma factor [Anaerolineales bacterium]